MNHALTLRILILAEIFLALACIAVGFFNEALLPAALREYQMAQDEAPWGWREWLLFAWCLPALPLTLSSWVSLWRGRRNARLLYTISWVATLPLLLFLQPEVMSSLGQFVDTAACLVSGMIFGLLYFSEYRHRYHRDFEDYWHNGEYDYS